MSALPKGWTPATLERFGVVFNGRTFTFPNGEVYDPDGDPKMTAPAGKPRDVWPDPAHVESDDLLVVEGRPDVLSAAELGFAAVSMPSTRKLREGEAARIAHGRRRTDVVSDCDPPNKAGRRQARAWAEEIAGYGPTFLADLDPERHDGFDVGDLLVQALDFYGEADGRKEARRVLLARLDRAEHVFARDPEPHAKAGKLTAEQRARIEAALRRVVLTPASAIRSERGRWLWRERVPLRGLTVVAGEKGLGKSLLTNAHAVAAITRGTLGGELHGTPADVLIVTAEDDWRTQVKPRLLAHGADLDHVHRVEVHDEHGVALLTLPDDVAALEARITGLREAGRIVAMLVVDPIGAFVPETANTHADAPVRRILAPLAAMADRQDLAVVVVMHLTKNDANRLIQRVSGAGAFVNASRSYLAMVKDPDDPDGEQGARRLLVHVATNWGRTAATLALHVEARTVDTDNGDRTEVGYLIVDGESSATVDDVQHGRDDDGDDAEEAIIATLAGGDRPSRQVKAQVKRELGCSLATIKRAAKRLADRGELVITAGGFPKTTTWNLAHAQEGTKREPTGEIDAVEPNPREPTGGISEPTEPTARNYAVEPNLGHANGQSARWAQSAQPHARTHATAAPDLDAYRLHRDRMLGECDDD